MMMLLALFVLVLVSCTEVVPNVQVCADKGTLGAICAYTRSGPTSKIPVATWSKQRIGWFCMDASAFGKYQTFIEDTCQKDQTCVDEINQFVNNLKVK